MSNDTPHSSVSRAAQKGTAPAAPKKQATLSLFGHGLTPATAD